MTLRHGNSSFDTGARPWPGSRGSFYNGQRETLPARGKMAMQAAVFALVRHSAARKVTPLV